MFKLAGEFVLGGSNPLAGLVGQYSSGNETEEEENNTKSSLLDDKLNNFMKVSCSHKTILIFFTPNILCQITVLY